MNIWTRKSIHLATNDSYLDKLYAIYPMAVNLRRELKPQTQQDLEQAFHNGDDETLLAILLKQDIFPIKDSYVAYLKHDKSAIERNPVIVQRLTDKLHEMGLEEIIDRITVPKETNRQIGPLFQRWLRSGALDATLIDNPQDLLNYSGNAIYDASDEQITQFATAHLGYRRSKRLDFLAKFNNQYIIAEAKFLSDNGGHQHGQFEDAVTTLRTELEPTNKTVRTIAILDGVLYIPSQKKMYKEITNNFSDSEVIISAVLLRDYLFSL